ncbi:hypothetical protein FUAX_23950 [Fulvitalea axinellae]|uniref:FAS1 domain-containing protein n=1 Tax=Fulvitalea axinellae TaxID=1182444 RepID=A0AAU9CPI8_9BACT|nr:hypothetical protein FUAX_23950 [Fulvitalea axinellae]
MNKIFRQGVRLVLGVMLCLPFVLFSCDDPVDTDTYDDSRLLTVIQYLRNSPDGEYDEWLKLLKASKYYGMLGARGNYTFLACKNEGMKAFYEAKGVSGIEGLEADYIDLLVKTHTVMTGFQSFSFNQGPMSDSTMNGNYLTVMFGQDGLNGLSVNQNSKIVERDVECSNGYLHTLDRPVEPIGNGVYKTLKALGKYNILAEAIEKAGLVDTLELRANSEDRLVQYTVFAETDDVFESQGINNFDDLVTHLNSGSDFTARDNKLHRFVRHHIITGKTYSNRFRSDIYLTIGKSMVKFVKDENKAYYLNPKYDDFGVLVDEGSNRLDLFNLDFQSKNAVIHTMKQILYEEELKPITVFDDFADVPELIGKRWNNDYNETPFFAKDIARWRAEGYDQFTYRYYNWMNAYGKDNLQCYSAFSGWFEFETKAILKGKYEVSVSFGTGCEGVFEISVDGEKSENTLFRGPRSFVIGDYEFKESGTHVIRFDSFAGGRLYLDRLMFKPI